MANTYTSRFNLTKPEVGADTNAWGGHLNADLDTIDSNMVSLLLTSAQTMAGALNLPSNGLNVGSGQLQVTGGNVTSTGNWTSVNGAFTGTMSVGGAATFAGASYSGAVTMSSSLGVTGAVTFSSTLSVSGLVTASTAPTLGGHLTNKTYVDTADALKLNLTGGTLTGNLSLVNSTNEMTLTLGSSAGYYYGNATTAGWKNSVGTNRVSWNISTGDFTAAGNITAYSDAKLKENVETIQEALSLVNRMRGVFYDRIDTGEHGVGVIAQEMQEVLPQVVIPNDGALSVAYGNIVGVLIEAVKELSAKIEKLEAR